ncbi:YidC/Oxa1 family membrane protein insertase [Patescibacteria group bacterium]|nr:YidC/Oxa1 family membrane protein insertase [Patescibacteria group bacterium]
MMAIYETLIHQPIYNLLVLLYDILPIGGVGLAIIVLTFIVKGILFPLNFKTMKSQRDMQEIQPKIKEIQEKFKDDKERMAKELMDVYKTNNVNPFASCLPLIIQLPVFIGLFRVLRTGLGEVDADMLYSFVQNPGVLDATFLGIDLAAVSIPLAVLAAVAQYFQVKQTLGRRPAPEVRNKPGARDENIQAQMSKMMLYFMPAITLFIGSTSLPGGVMLYWLATTALTIVLYKIFLSDKKEKKADIIDVEAK